MDRLDKFVSENSTLSRSDAKNAIKGGRVTVNGVISKSPEMKVSESDEIVLDKKPLKKSGMIYIMLNKPQGIISATEDGREKTVVDFVKADPSMKERIGKRDIFPIGRLDKDTEGLIILTDDGPLCHDLLSPKHHVEKVYYAECAGKLCDDAVKMFSEGVQVGEDYKAAPAGLKILEKNDSSCKLEITLIEGKFHEVKRMCHEAGVEVTFLKRIRFGKLSLPADLGTGEFKEIPDFPEKVR